MKKDCLKKIGRALFGMQCYNIVITLHLTISPWSIITCYNIASQKGLYQFFSNDLFWFCTIVYYQKHVKNL
jgi:hypothetical protein